MDKSQIVKEIENLVELWKINTKLYDNLKKLLLVDPEPPLFERIDDNFSNYVRMVSMATGINLDALHWFIWENDCGQRKSQCSKIDGKSVAIKNAKTFVDFELS